MLVTAQRAQSTEQRSNIFAEYHRAEAQARADRTAINNFTERGESIGAASDAGARGR
jgi:hypothetical protein